MLYLLFLSLSNPLNQFRTEKVCLIFSSTSQFSLETIIKMLCTLFKALHFLTSALASELTTPASFCNGGDENLDGSFCLKMLCRLNEHYSDSSCFVIKLSHLLSGGGTLGARMWKIGFLDLKNFPSYIFYHLLDKLY